MAVRGRISVHFLLSCALLFLKSQLAASTGGNDTDSSDRLALLAFKAAISSDPSGAMSSWNGSVPLCQWAGVTCTQQRVTGLILESKSLSGIISSSLANLTRLTTLRLSGNMLTGALPPEMGSIQTLRLLDLSSNDLLGAVPPQLQYLSNLTYLNLTRNSLTGKIPSPLGKLGNLDTLDLSSNNLTGQITPQLGDLTSLTTLQLSSNALNGDIPATIGNLSRLGTLDLSKNKLTGEIPTQLGNLQRLTFFKISNNMLSGPISTSIYNLSALIYLYVNDNLFSGELSSNMGTSLPNLRVLHTYDNQLTGPIPTSLTNISGLEKIDMSYNKLTGKIPANLGMLKNLSYLRLDNNRLEANKASDWEFILSLTNCTMLEHLNLNVNNLSGSLPSTVGNLSVRLTWLSMSDNQITGKIPFEISNLVNLARLNLKGNQFTGKIPDSIGNLQNLQLLVLHKNKLSREIPSSIGNLTQLVEIYLGHNQLEGEIPPSIGNCQHLNVMDLSHNRLSGSIPKKLMSLSSLTYYLILSHNMLSGPLPSEVAQLQSLDYLDLSYNNLSNPIPYGLGQCLALETLKLNNNSFNGSIPISFKNLRGLKTIDLSHNNLSGDFPDYLAKFPYLENVNLSYNDLTGRVPEDGIFANNTAFAVTGNNQLCGGILSLDLHACLQETPKKDKHLVLKISFSIACSILLVMFVCFLYIAYILKRSMMNKKVSFNSPIEDQFLHISYAYLVNATNNFSSENLIGVGAYGSVFKGNLNGNNLIAVKVFDLQQHGASKSFMAECETLRNIRHRNLLKILTACASLDSSGSEFKALVFEYMPNGNLDMLLNPKVDQKVGSWSLTLAERVNIAVDVATALDYLHNYCSTPIVHCDLKPSNVLLDEDMIAHVGDFGLARFFQKIDEKGNKPPSTSVAVKGSIGYVPPEYGVGNHISPQGDVYSYGVLLLELFTGKRPTDDLFKDGLNLQKFVENQLSNGYKAAQIVDASLIPKESSVMGETLENSLHLILRTGLSCAKERPSERMEIKDVLTQLVETRELLLPKMQKLF